MTEVKAVPDEYPGVCPYITVDNAAEAIDYYSKVLGAEEVYRMTLPGTDVIVHAELKLGKTCFMLGQSNADMGAHSPKHFGGSPVSMHFYTEDVDALFAKAQESGAEIQMPPTDMFWGDRMAKFVDTFGHSWSIATHFKDVGDEEMAEGLKAMMAEGN